jgi:hypothetical protein
MPLNILFWVIYLIALLVSWWGYYDAGKPWFRPFGGALAVWVLVGILGWRVFGPAVR